MAEIMYDFREIGATLRMQRLDDWWQPAKSEPEPQLDQNEIRSVVEKTC
jgi:hypothetical protein